MHLFDIGKSTLKAQSTLLQYGALRISRRVVFFVLAALFGFFSLIVAHGVFWSILTRCFHLGPIASSLIVFGVDLALAVICLLLGLRRCPYITPKEAKARSERDRYLAQLRESLSIGRIIATVAAVVGTGIPRKLLDIFLRSKTKNKKK